MKTVAILWVLFGWVPLFAKDAPKRRVVVHQTYDEENGWIATATPSGGKARPLRMPEGRAPWPGWYYSSPDRRWIIQLQKTGSGDNTVYVYRVERKNLTVGMGLEVGPAGWKCWSKTTGQDVSNLYHQHFEFIRWSKTGTRVLLHMSAGDVRESGKGVFDFPVWYNLEKGTFSAKMVR